MVYPILFHMLCVSSEKSGDKYSGFLATRYVEKTFLSDFLIYSVFSQWLHIMKIFSPFSR